MSQESAVYCRLAHQMQARAQGRSAEAQGVLHAVAATYVLLAHVWETLDDKSAVYTSEGAVRSPSYAPTEERRRLLDEA